MEGDDAGVDVLVARDAVAALHKTRCQQRWKGRCGGGGACVGACVLSMRSGYLGRKEKRGEVRQSEVLCVR